jgi:hypothetical protein
MSACPPTTARKRTLSDFRDGSTLGRDRRQCQEFRPLVRRMILPVGIDELTGCIATSARQSGAPIIRVTLASVNRGTSSIIASVSADASAA